jgi:hypothetical protein
MPRRSATEDDWDDVSPYGGADDEETTVPCPYCGREIHEDSQRCPYCERYVSQEDAPPSRKPWWLIGGAALCILAVYFWIVGR